MRRTAMPRRRAGLVRRTPLVARKAFDRKVRARTGPAREVVGLVYERAQYACELCLVPVGPRRGVEHHLHHRRPRRAGGTARPDANGAANLLLVDPSCHEVLETRRADAYAGGWLLHDRQNPARTPVLIGAERWVYLTADGRYVAELPEVA
jgi:5-methylcytosine-specific restriction enzyme A